MAVFAKSIQNFQVEISTDHQVWYSDEPADAGGDDTAATPMQQLWGALAACKIITVQLYAQRKGWKLEGMEVTVRHERKKVADVPESKQSDANGAVEVVETDIRIWGEGLTSEQISRMAEIAERCPVHRTLVNEVVIRKNVLV
ncbi:MAG TPA: OsmC family protein [Anaerolineales bacterium]|nr:OsmC family protein [Anaerolineales bacterium]